MKIFSLLESNIFAPKGANFVSYATPLWLIDFICLAFIQDIKGAKACVTFAQGNQLYIAGQPSFFNYSTSQKIQRPE